MNDKNFTSSILVYKRSKAVHDIVSNVRGYPIDYVDGSSPIRKDVFSIHCEDLPSYKQKLLNPTPDKKVVWIIADSRLSFSKETNEWTGTKGWFEFSLKDEKTLHFITHKSPALTWSAKMSVHMR